MFSNFNVRWGKVLWYAFLCIIGWGYVGWVGPVLVLLASVDVEIS